jgi:hypothetical protein
MFAEIRFADIGNIKNKCNNIVFIIVFYYAKIWGYIYSKRLRTYPISFGDGIGVLLLPYGAMPHTEEVPKEMEQLPRT